MKDRLSKAEITKDALQETVEAGAQTVGQVMAIITGAVRDVTQAIGGFATDAFEIREGVRKAKAELGERAAVDEPEVSPSSAATD